MFKSITIGTEEYKIRYTASSIISMQQTGGKVLGANRKISVAEIFKGLSDFEFLMFVFWKGLQAFRPNIKLEEAQEAYDKYVDEDDPENLDNGGQDGKFIKFMNTIMDALNGELHTDTVKAKKRQEEEQKKQKAEWEKDLITLIDERIALKMETGIGNTTPESVSVPSA
ncbi:MAG: hypothetical protein ACE14P_14080 [Methanotrichaceae archaeon]